MNKVILIGRIVKDPEIRYNTSGTSSVLNFTLAVDKQTRDAQGNRSADFINCVAWNQPADFISRFVKKGYLLCVSGRIQNRNYQGQDGQMRYVTEVVVETVENLTPRDNYQQPTNQNFQGNQFNDNHQPSFGGQYQAQQQPKEDPYQGFANPVYGEATKDVQAPDTFVNLDDDDTELPF